MTDLTNTLLPPDLKAILYELFDLLHSDAEQNNQLQELLGTNILNGPDCDELPDAQGEFGRSEFNPIPVNGPLGEILYLSRLRWSPGGGDASSPVMFHRLTSIPGQLASVDVYQVQSLDGSVRENLFLSMYHPRKSRRAPDGYTFVEKFDPDNMTYGVNYRVPNFPRALDAHVRKWHLETLGIPLPVSRIRQAINGSPLHPSILDDDIRPRQ